MGPLPGGGQGLRVSRPGNDVLDTGLTTKQLAFDSRWPATARVHMTGDLTITSGYTTVNFGVTFPSIPPVFSWHKTATGVFQPLSMGFNGNFNIGWITSDFDFRVEWVRIFNDHAEFIRPGTGTSTVRYLILRPF